jgi:ribosomal protein S18 acetylase RimI-like enzyme
MIPEFEVRTYAVRYACAIATIQVHTSLLAYKGIFSSASSTLTVERRTPVWSEITGSTQGHHRVLVAQDSMGICGYVHFGPSRDPTNATTAGELYSIYVAPDHWRQGIGGKLLVESMNALGGVGFDACTL